MIHLVPQEPPKALGIDEAKGAANNAYTKARAAQRALVARLDLTEMLYRPGMVSYVRLKGERHAAREQLARAQSVVDALDEAIAALEATDPRAAR